MKAKRVTIKEGAARAGIHWRMQQKVEGRQSTATLFTRARLTNVLDLEPTEVRHKPLPEAPERGEQTGDPFVQSQQATWSRQIRSASADDVCEVLVWLDQHDTRPSGRNPGARHSLGQLYAMKSEGIT